MTSPFEEQQPDGTIRKGLFLRSESSRLGIFLLHPTGGSAKASLLGGRWHEQPDISICAPEALGYNPDEPAGQQNPRAWSSRCGPMAQRQLDDATYLLDLARRFKAQLPEGTPLCLVGHSNGCAIGFNQLLNRADHPFDAATLYAANWAHPKTSVKAIPLLYMAGELDPIYPWSQPTFVETPWFSYQTVPTGPTIQAWIKATGLIDDGLGESGSERDYTWQRWVGDAGCAFEFRLLHGQGHHWPAGLPLDERLQQVLGPNNEQLDATGMAMDFFTEQLALDEGILA